MCNLAANKPMTPHQGAQILNENYVMRKMGRLKAEFLKLPQLLVLFDIMSPILLLAHSNYVEICGGLILAGTVSGMELKEASRAK